MGDALLVEQTKLKTAPLSRAQQMIWAGHQLDPSQPVFNTAWRFDFHGSIDPNRFAAAFQSVVEVCDALRAVIDTQSDGNAHNHDTGVAAGRHEMVDAGSTEAASDWMATAIRHCFDLSRETFHSALIKVQDDHWVWYFNQHHIMTDALSGRLIFDAVKSAYFGNQTLDLPSFLTNHADVSAENAEYWRSVATHPKALPRLYGRSLDGTSAASVMVTQRLDDARMQRLDDLLTQKGFGGLSRQQALFKVFSAVMTAWMHRVSAQSNIPLGIVSHGRANLNARATAGCFIELFPLETNVTDGMRFSELHGQISQDLLQVLRHASPGSSDANNLTRFNTVVNVIPAQFDAWGDTPVDVEWLDSGCMDQRHAARLNVLELAASAGIDLAIAFNTNAFDASLRAAALRHILTLLDAFLQDPETPIGHVALATPDDSAARATKRGLTDARPVNDVVSAFEASCAHDPQATVIEDGGHTVSREDLSQKVDAIAEVLLAKGVLPGDRVGVHLDRSADLVASLLAILKIGASFVPLDPDQPAARLAEIETLADARLVLTQTDMHWNGTSDAVDVTRIATRPNQSVEPGPETHPAYVLFTSGSTGTPKGVVISRASLARYAMWAQQTFGESDTASWALHSAIGFDLTLTSIFAPLMTGGKIKVYPGKLAVLDVFADNAVDVVKLTPAHLRLALETDLQPGSIRALVLGGEALSTSLASHAKAALGTQLKVFNEYGPTEATVGCMVHEFDPPADTDATVPIGRPAADTAIYVLDDAGNPVPDHVQGELFIAGQDRLALGYLNRPDETDAAFIDNPFAQGRMYRSGDLASVRPDGVVLYHGRNDAQLKLNGIRIETTEIEAQTLKLPGVLHAAVSVYDQEAAKEIQCRTCGVSKSLPQTEFSDPTLCKTCAEFDAYSAKVDSYFGDAEEFAEILNSRKQARTGPYDCVMLLSGGKDSTYALSRLAEVTPNVLAATLDNGFISDGAKANIDKIVKALGIDHRWLTTPAMNDIFVDSLKRYSNVCQGCFKTIYTLAYELARDVGAPTIVTGLSRGQLFETRLTPELFARANASRSEIDDMVLQARRSYHHVPDVAAQRLNGTLFDGDDLIGKIEVVDFYRYFDVPMREVYEHLEGSVGWSRPMDTGRSTNCLINDVGIHVHKVTRGYHNYALPYSWDVRLGHKQRNDALEELDDSIDEARVSEILDEIGFEAPVEPQYKTRALVMYVRTDGSVTPQDIRSHLLGTLSREVVPDHIIPVDRIPLTPNGKTDFNALPTPELMQLDKGPVVDVDDSELSDIERKLVEVWRRVLGQAGLGIRDNFYDLGGDSLRAIQISTQCASLGLQVRPQDIFRHQTVVKLASNTTAQPAHDPKAPPPAARARRNLSSRDKAQLQNLFGKKRDG